VLLQAVEPSEEEAFNKRSDSILPTREFCTMTTSLAKRDDGDDQYDGISGLPVARLMLSEVPCSPKSGIQQFANGLSPLCCVLSARIIIKGHPYRTAVDSIGEQSVYRDTRDALLVDE
jgi:hypothetical protein